MKESEKRFLRKILPPLVTIIIFILILLRVNLNDLLEQFSVMNLYYFGASFLLFIPLVLIKSERWRYIIRDECCMSPKKAAKITLVGAVFMAFTPSQLGDVAKADFLKKEGFMRLRRGVPSVLFEKFLDMFTLCIFCVAGILVIGLGGILIPIFVITGTIAAAFIFIYAVVLSSSRHLSGLLERFFRLKWTGIFIQEAYSFMLQTRGKTKITAYLAYSFLLWLFVIFQIYLFFAAFGFYPATELIFGLIPPALLIGMIPVTVAGIGTRDSALLILFGAYAPLIPVAAVLGVAILCTFRYFVPAIAGMPFTGEYLKKF